MTDLHREKDASWMAAAACRDAPPEWFFPEAGDGGHGTFMAKQLCRRCPVIRACEAYAMSEPVEVHGVFGGMSAKERQRLRRKRR